MLQHCDNLIKMGSTLSDARFSIIIMSSLPDSYQPTLQTITAAECANSTLGSASSTRMKLDDLIMFLTEEAQHQVINDEHTKTAESALMAHSKKVSKSKTCRGKASEHPCSTETCENCKKTSHTKSDCWSKGGGKEGQGPWSWKSKSEEKPESAVVA